MENKKARAIFRKVKELSETDKLLWKPEADGTTFYTSVHDFKVYIGRSVGTIVFELFNSHNDKIGLLEHGGYSDNTPGLSEFYEYIRHKVLKLDDGLDDLLDQLEQLD